MACIFLFQHLWTTPMCFLNKTTTKIQFNIFPFLFNFFFLLFIPLFTFVEHQFNYIDCIMFTLKFSSQHHNVLLCFHCFVVFFCCCCFCYSFWIVWLVKKTPTNTWKYRQINHSLLNISLCLKFDKRWKYQRKWKGKILTWTWTSYKMICVVCHMKRKCNNKGCFII